MINVSVELLQNLKRYNAYTAGPSKENCGELDYILSEYKL
jgi:hypothetical protein